MGFQIPLQYQDKLEPFEYGEKRTDDEIFRSLLEFQPVRSEKNIWTFWDSGIESMPAWCRRNVISWVRICGPEWTIRVLDHNPGSPNYAKNYISKGLPDAFYDKTMDGTHSGPHSADFLRGACLYEYGGAWVDSSIFLMRNMDDICWNRLEDSACPLRVAVPVMTGNLLNCFVAARKHDPFIKRWHEIFMYVWQGRTNSDGLAQHPLLTEIVPYFMESLDIGTGPGIGLGPNVQMDKLVEYGLQMVCWRRVCMLEDPKDGFSGPDYWANNILWIDLYQELLLPFRQEGSNIPAFDRGEKLFESFSVQRDPRLNTAQYTEAENTTWTLLTESSMMKIGTIKGMVNWVSLGTLWNMPANLGKDNEPGSFAELLRYVPMHFRQIRKGISTLEATRPPVTFKKGVLEP
ncbi:capsular polysaccharide synthesis protein-domain-containing protein [Nemania sp. NC0429]|nr:capsular polysaccharide synthesis protein-domain-containing protein [Nemania sp. NC0429]